MSTTPIFLLAPAPGMTFVAMPSGAAYVADGNGLVVVTNGSVADQLALIAAGCATLEPNAGGNVTVQTGTSYTVQPTDNGANIVFSDASPVAVTLPNTSQVGFAVSLFQGGVGQITAQAASGGSVVTPNVGTTPGQYCALTCLCIANATGANAQWDVIAEPSVTGGGLVGAQTLSALYSQDTSAHYAQYSVAQVFQDGTSANDGFWLKTGAGNGSGNWTQQPTAGLSLPSLNVAINAEVTRAEAAETALTASVTSNAQWIAQIKAESLIASGIWADDINFFNIAYTDLNGNVLDGSLSKTGVRYSTNPNVLSTNALWADETYGLYAITDSNGNLIEGQTAAGFVWPTPQLSTADRTALNLWEFIAGAQLWSDESYGIPFTDSNGNVILGVRKDGSVDIAKLNVSQSALTPTDATALTSWEFIAGGYLWADENYGIPFTDQNGNVLFGLRKNGTVDIPQANVTASLLSATDAAAMTFFEATFLHVWDETYGLAFTDGDNSVLAGIRHNGSVDIFQLNASPSGWLPIINPADGGLWAGNGASEFKIAAPQGATALLSPPQLTGEIVQWLDSNVSPWELREFYFNGAGQVPANITTLMHIPLYGESTSVGTDASVLYTTSPVSVTQAFMFNAGTRTVPGDNFNDTNINAKAPDSQQVSLIPLQEIIAPGESPLLDAGFGETQLSGTAYSIINLGSFPSTTALIGSSHGMGGANIGQLVKGSAQYLNLLRAVERGKALAGVLGTSFVVPAVIYVQGINDWRDTESTYNAALTTLQSNLTSDINAITGGSGQVPLMVVQYACWTSTHQADQAAAPPNVQGFLDAYMANPTKIILVGNSYHLPWFSSTDGVHMLAQGYRAQGEEIGRVISGLLASSTPGPLYATTCAGAVNSLTITFNAATQLAIDTSVVSDPGQYGLTLSDSSNNNVTLSSIAVSGTNQITATTGTALTNGVTYTLGIANTGTAGSNAGPTTGPRSCVRDSAPESYSSPSLAGRMYRYACSQALSFVAT